MTTKTQKQEYQKTLNVFRENAPHLEYYHTRALMDKLHRYETTLHRINENDCNGHPRTKTEIRDGKMYRFDVEDLKWAERDAKKEASIQNKVKAIAEELHFQVQFNGDPRGGAIQFILPSKKSNSWNNEVWGIYW